MKIAVDAMGGDFAPLEIVKGVELARDANPQVEFQLYGDQEQINAILERTDNIEIIHTPEVITMEDEPVKAIRTKKQSSLVLAAQAVADQKADAFFSAGNSGAVLAAGLFIIGRIKGIDRPGLVTTLPVILNDQTDKFVMLDVGANADSKVFNLYQYAVMGNYYATNVLKIDNPRIGLLNNGTESDKGDMFHKKVYDVLANSDQFNFVGNVESRDVLRGVADIVVTDGFTGNAVLKSIEGTALNMLKLVKQTIMNGGVSSKLGGLMLKGSFKEIAKSMDYSKHGGAVLLGLSAPVIKTHGSSKRETVKNTFTQIETIINSNLVGDLKTYVSEHKEQMALVKDSLKSDK